MHLVGFLQPIIQHKLRNCTLMFLQTITFHNITKLNDIKQVYTLLTAGSFGRKLSNSITDINLHRSKGEHHMYSKHISATDVYSAISQCCINV